MFIFQISIHTLQPVHQESQNKVYDEMFNYFRGHGLREDEAKAVAEALLPNINEFRGITWKKIKEDLDKIAQATDVYAFKAFKALSNPTVATLFAKYPDKFVSIAQATDVYAFKAFKALLNDKVATLFAKYPDKFVSIAQATGEYGGWAFEALSNPTLAEMFSQNPNLIIEKFKEITKVTGKYAYSAFEALLNDKVATLFAKYPDKFVSIAQATGEDAYRAFEALLNDKVATLFEKYPDKFVSIAQATGKYGAWAFEVLSNPTVATLFAKYPDKFVSIAQATGKSAVLIFMSLSDEPSLPKYLKDATLLFLSDKILLNQLVFQLKTFLPETIELGRRIDDLHDRERERMNLINSQSTETILSLLCSDPQLFYTSTNHLLFDRLKKDLNNKPVSVLLNEFGGIGLDSAIGRNLLFRAITYDRIYGRENSILQDKEVDEARKALLSPLDRNEFDSIYFFVLANAINVLLRSSLISKDETVRHLTRTLENARRNDSKSLISSIEYLLVMVDPSTKHVSDENKGKITSLQKLTTYYPEQYKGKDGYITCVQIFKNEDVGKDHWPLSQTFFENLFGRPKKGNEGELIYEKNKKRVILYMGESPQNNQDFIKRKIDELDNLILTFRGHSFSLLESFPYNIFGNKQVNILFIPGSCGSAGSTAEYIMSNQNTNLSFVANTSTGRGQVTNALVEIFLGIDKPTEFQKIKTDNESKISKYGGDVHTLTFSSEGELLLRYVNLQNAQTRP
ncbi:MAG: hypothetical protein QXW70_03550 [Candidatus Anstonellales archaeon]